MIFRPAERSARSDTEERARRLTDAVTERFGRAPDELAGDHALVDGVPFLLDGEGRLVVVPACDLCGSNDPAKFPYEPWTVLGVPVLGQATTACRDCRFRLIASGRWAPPLQLE